MSKIIRHRAFTASAWDHLLPYFHTYGSLTSSEVSKIIENKFLVPFHPRKTAAVLKNDKRFKVRRPDGSNVSLYSLS